MKSRRYINRRASSTLAAVSLLLAIVAPGLIPAFASAAQLTSRSVTLSNSTASATGVTYEVKFTVTGAAGAYVIDFCKDSPVVGQTCTAPTGFTASAATTATSGATIATAGTSTLKITQTVAASSSVDLVLTGITNPSSVTDGFYARIVTYDTPTDAAAYTATVLGTGAADNGGVAMAITSAIGVTAAVRESMTFCVASVAITLNCGNASLNAPTLPLGEASGGSTVALNPTALSTGTVYTQLSTNAASGAVIRMKSDATGCGGLLRLGDTTHCYIGPATTGGFTFGTAKFGVMTGASTGTSGYANASGTLEPVTGSGYNSSTYLMNYTAGDTAGVTSTYGDPFLDSSGTTIDNQNMPLTFGASVSNDTPAGTYTANISLIAAGTF